MFWKLISFLLFLRTIKKRIIKNLQIINFVDFIYLINNNFLNCSLQLVFTGGTDDIRISRVGDGHGADAEVSTASSTQVNVGTTVVLDFSLGQHGVVFNFRFSTKKKMNTYNNHLQ